MIPKIIHYCWFGKGDKPSGVQKCIASWKKYCPDYEIIEWNEHNFDINYGNYSKMAYEYGKYAFVSDVARLYALYNFGGIYMDTDVEVIRSFNDILNKKCIFGFEEKNYVATSFMASEKGDKTIKQFLSLYDNESFKNTDGTLNTKTNVSRLTKLLQNKGFELNGQIQEIDNISLYSKEYFSPYDYINCVDERTDNTYCIHWFYVSWMSFREQLKKRIKKVLVKIIGKKNMNCLRGIIKS